jgi:hypothetical protein
MRAAAARAAIDFILAVNGVVATIRGIESLGDRTPHDRSSNPA